MKVAYIISMSRGIARFIYREIEALERRGIEVHIFPVPKGSGLYMPKPEWGHYRYRFWLIIFRNLSYMWQKPGRYFSLLWEAVKSRSIPSLVLALDFAFEMNRRGIDKIHCHFGDYKLFVGYYCKQVLGLPLSATIHSYELYRNPNPKLCQRALHACDHVFGISEYTQNCLCAKFNLRRDRVSIMHLFAEVPERELINLLVVADFIPVKGHEYLFKALKNLARDDLILWVVGNGELNLGQMAADMGIGEQVLFMGRIGGKKLDSLYQACHIFCLPSVIDEDGNQEGLPVSLMEAMAHAKPVIATDCGGTRELVSEVLLPPRDVQALAQAIALLADDKKLRLKQGKRNQRVIQAKFAEENVEPLKKYFSGIQR